MKKAKKLASLLLALVMALALAVPAMAADTGSITLDNPREGQTYTAYKIFDVVYNADNTAYSYTISGTSEWLDVVATVDAAAGTATSKIAGLTFTKAANGNTYVVTKGDGFNAATFANTLKANTGGKTGEPMTVADGKATATGLPLGYYFVSSTNGALCNLTTTDPTAEIHDKNDMPFEKTVSDSSVEVGQTITYTIKGKVPDTTGFSEYTYKITDTMSEGLTFQKNVVVKIGDTDVTDCITTYTPSDDTATGFELTIPVKNYQGQVGQPIIVTYTAVVNENAAGDIETNSASLTYSNDPVTGGTGKPITPTPVPVYSAKIDIIKHKTGDKTTKLADAKFVLYKEVAGAKEYYKYDSATEDVSWVTNQTEATEVTTDANGAASFLGLEDGTYYLLETAAPAGYNLLDEPVEIVIDGSTATETNLTPLNIPQEVANSTGAELPETGGMGTTIFYVTGSILVLAAVVLLVTKKRMKAAK